MGDNKKTNLFEVLWALGAFAFRKLNLLEYKSDKLSLTNLAVLVCVIKVAVAPVVSIPEIGALLLSLLNYGHKRYESGKANQAAIEAQAKVDAQQESVIKEAQKAIEELQSKVNDQAKILEEAKSVLTAQKLNATIKRSQL